MSHKPEIPFAAPCCLPSAPHQSQSQSQQVPTVRLFTSSARVLTTGMIRVEGATFWMGDDSCHARVEDGEGPVRAVRLRPFWLDSSAVSNSRFSEFVEATGYRTEAEKFGWSYVFHKHVSGENKRKVQGASSNAPWWVSVEGACWHAPEGPKSSIKKRGDHPVVHVSWNDAQAFCSWHGKRLPTEAEWELAARGGLQRRLFAWGDELVPKGRNGKPEHRCNIWQGRFPDLDTARDGFTGTAPVKSFAPNGLGFYQMSGNTWEWCEDSWSIRHEPAPWDDPLQNPVFLANNAQKTIRGGSFLCHASYCNRYRVAARTANTPDSTTSHCGFRCALDAEILGENATDLRSAGSASGRSG